MKELLKVYNNDNDNNNYNGITRHLLCAVKIAIYNIYISQTKLETRGTDKIST